MAELTYKTNLTLWLKSQFGVPGLTGYWYEQSGRNADFTLSGTPKPYGVPGGPTSFDGSTQFATGPGPGSGIFAVNHATLFVAFRATSAPSTSASPWADGAIYHGTVAAAPVMSVGTVTGVVKLLANIQDSTPTNHPVSININLGQWYVGWMGWDGSKLYLAVDPINYTGVSAGNCANWGASSSLIGKNYNGTAYFNGDIGEMIGFSTFLGETDRCTVFNYLSAEWIAGRGDVLEIARDVSSRDLLSRSRVRFYALGVPMEQDNFGGLDQANECFVSDPGGLHPAGLGWGETYDWQPRPGRMMEKRIDFDNLVTDYGFADLRLFRHTLAFSNKLDRLGARREGDLSGGDAVAEYFYRDSNALCLDPSDCLGYALVPENERVVDRDGYVALMPGYTGLYLRSSFVSQLTGLTTSLGGNGSTIAADSTKLLLDATVTGYSCKITAGNPVLGDSYVQTGNMVSPGGYQAPSSWGITFIADQALPDGSCLAYQLVDSVRGYWAGPSNPSSWSMNFGNSWIPLTPDSRNRYDAVVPVSLNTFYLRFGFVGLGHGPASIPQNGAIRNVYHWQMTPNGIRLNLGVADAAICTMGDEMMQKAILSPASMPVAGAPLGAQTLLMKFRSYAGGGMWLGVGDWSALAGDGWTLLIAPTYVEWGTYIANAQTFNIRSTANPATLTPYVDVRVAVRRISSHGDLGLAPYYTDLFVNGAKVTDPLNANNMGGTGAVECATHPNPTYPGLLTVSGSAGGGSIHDFFASPYALTDEEIAAWGL